MKQTQLTSLLLHKIYIACMYICTIKSHKISLGNSSVGEEECTLSTSEYRKAQEHNWLMTIPSQTKTKDLLHTWPCNTGLHTYTQAINPLSSALHSAPSGQKDFWSSQPLKGTEKIVSFDGEMPQFLFFFYCYNNLENRSNLVHQIHIETNLLAIL